MSKDNLKPDLKTALKVFQKQLEALDDKDLEKFRQFFTPHLRDQISEAAFEKIRTYHLKHKLDQNVFDLEHSGVVGDDRLELKLWNGNTFLTMARIEKTWLVDTLFFM